MKDGDEYDNLNNNDDEFLGKKNLTTVQNTMHDSIVVPIDEASVDTQCSITDSLSKNDITTEDNNFKDKTNGNVVEIGQGKSFSSPTDLAFPSRSPIDSIDSKNNIAFITNSSFKGSSHHDKTRLLQHRENININLPNDVKELYPLIGQYEGLEIELKTTLKCFIPPYIPAINKVDDFIKVPRPDGKPDGLGLSILDEPCQRQSDPAVLELHLRATSKQHHGEVIIRSIENAAENPSEIDRWIKNVENLHHKTKDTSLPVVNDGYLLKSDRFLDSFSEVFVAKVCDGEIKPLNPRMDLTLHEYTQIICSLCGVPFYEGKIIQSVYNIFCCLQFQEMQQVRKKL